MGRQLRRPVKDLRVDGLAPVKPVQDQVVTLARPVPRHAALVLVQWMESRYAGVDSRYGVVRLRTLEQLGQVARQE